MTLIHRLLKLFQDIHAYCGRQPDLHAARHINLGRQRVDWTAACCSDFPKRMPKLFFQRDRRSVPAQCQRSFDRTRAQVLSRAWSLCILLAFSMRPASRMRCAFVRPDFTTFSSALAFRSARARVLRALPRPMTLLILAQSSSRAAQQHQRSPHRQSPMQWLPLSRLCHSYGRSWPPWSRCHSQWWAQGPLPASTTRA